MYTADEAVIIVRERKERFARLFAEPAVLLDTVCSHVANGGSATQLARAWDFRFSDLHNWLWDKQFPERAEAYKLAVAARNEWEKEMILAELSNIAHIDVRKLYNENGALRNPDEWDEETAKAVASIETREEKVHGTDETGENLTVGIIHKVKLHSKIEALKLLGKNLAMFNDKKDVSLTLTIEDLVRAASGEVIDVPSTPVEAPARIPESTPPAQPQEASPA